MDLNRGTVQGNGIDLDPDDLSMLQPFKYTIKHPGFRPATPAGIDGVPAPKAFGQAAPFAALLGNVKDGVQDLKVCEADIAALTGQTVFNQAILFFGDFHTVSISYPAVSVNRP